MKRITGVLISACMVAGNVTLITASASAEKSIKVGKGISKAGRTLPSALNTILSGVGTPSASFGHDGDFYIDRKSWQFFGPKTKGRWPLPVLLVGPTGSQGATGAVGPVGAQGKSGVKGEGGSSGAVGSATITAGSAGPIGPSGPAGASGSLGAAGLAGVAGSTGPSGSSGPIGPSGPAGSPGSLGAAGPVGLTGSTGASGSSGPAGVTGATGSSGLPGPTGATGATGAQGIQGDIGLTGAIGSTGSVGPLGPVGPTGATGSTGTTGATGSVGPRGPSRTISGVLVFASQISGAAGSMTASSPFGNFAAGTNYSVTLAVEVWAPSDGFTPPPASLSISSVLGAPAITLWQNSHVGSRLVGTSTISSTIIQAHAIVDGSSVQGLFSLVTSVTAREPTIAAPLHVDGYYVAIHVETIN